MNTHVHYDALSSRVTVPSGHGKIGTYVERSALNKPVAHPHTSWLIPVVLMLAAFVLRCSQFGNPLIHVDENFYLLVGDRMLHGALPYVDIWDRKPVGLFVLYAAIRMLGGSGIVQYQVVATLFAGATAYVVALITRHVTTAGAALVAGLVYLLLIGVADGMGGQSPVFYNLPVAIAALVTMKAYLQPGGSSADLRRSAVITMALIGLSLQIKYNVVFEGMFFGLVYLHLRWQRDGRVVKVATDAVLLGTIALLPTLIALGFYVYQGDGTAFLYANFFSIFERSSDPAATLFSRIGKTWLVLQLPVFCVILSATLQPWRFHPGGRQAYRFILTWLGVGVFGYVVFGTYFDHYALPLMAPLAVAGAPLFSIGRRQLGRIAAGLVLLTGTAGYAAAVQADDAKRGGARTLEAMVAAIRPRLTNCLYVFNGDPILYYATPSCIPTRYAFPNHLNLRREGMAIGVDPGQEVRRILAGHPSVVVDTVGDNEKAFDGRIAAMARSVLARDYRAAAVVRHGRESTIIYAVNRHDGTKADSTSAIAR